MKSFLNQRIYVSCLITFMTLLNSCTFVSRNDCCGVFLNLGEYEISGDLDFLVINKDSMYYHYFIHGDEISQSYEKWNFDNILGSIFGRIDFYNWKVYGNTAIASPLFYESNNDSNIFKTTYVRGRIINLPDEDLDYYKLSKEEIQKYGIDSIIDNYVHYYINNDAELSK